MELIQQELTYFTPTTGKFSGFTETTDAIIPDSYPDIDEVAFSCATINVKDELPQADRVLVSGQIDAVVLYRSGDDPALHQLNIPLSFAHIEEAPGVGPDALFFMRCGVSQVSVRIVNSRKISVSCSAVLESECCQPTTARLTAEADDETGKLEQRRRMSVVPLASAVAVRRFVVLDDIEMEQGAAPAPLHTEVELRGTECSVENGRIILNGSARLRIWDLRDEGTVSVRTHDIPFHQIIDADGLSDGAPTRVQLSCHSAICHYSNEDILSVNLNTEALFWQEAQKELRWVDDLYHLEDTLQANFQPLTLASCSHGGAFSGECTETLSAAHPVSEVLSASALCTSVLPVEDNALKLILACSVLYLDDTRQLRQLDRQQTCAFRVDADIRDAQPVCIQLETEPSVHDNQIALGLRVSGQLVRCVPVSLPNLTDVQCTPAPDAQERPLKLIFVRDSQPLWQIAKENRATVQAIRQSNHLAENMEQVSNAVLLVP